MKTLFCKGSEWRIWDLHFHTPASFDYKNKNITNQDIIDGLISNNVSVVAITDHHVIDVPRIKELQRLAGAHLTILPGIELRSELGGSESVHFIGIFPENANIEEIWLDLQSGCDLKQSRIIAEGDDRIYCDLKDTCQIIHDLGGIVTIHAGGKSNTIESIKNNHLFKQKLKTDIVRDYIDVFELGAIEDQVDYNQIVFPSIGFRRPMILCSDNHSIKDYSVKEKLWIKADPNFEGLKQIMHEPEDRIRIQGIVPEDKAGYQVIERIEIQTPHIYNSVIQINPNLNSVIGGRSAGKSILLGAIAKKLKTDKPIRFEHNLEYDEFVNEISKDIKVIWKDKEENNEREIEYFEQGYMHDLARSEKKLSKLIQDILKQRGKELLLNKYESIVTGNKRRINDLVADLFWNLNAIKEKRKKVSDKGDKKGIEDEINRLTEELSKHTATEITLEEKLVYEQCKKDIQNANNKRTALQLDAFRIEALKNVRLVKDNIMHELTSLSEERRHQIDTIFNEAKIEFIRLWETKLDEVVAHAKKDDLLEADIVAKEKQNAIYQKVIKAYNDSTQLSEFESKIAIQKNKLFEIVNLLNEIDELIKQKELLVESIISEHKNFYNVIVEVLPALSEASDGLEIKAKVKFNLQHYRDILISALNQQNAQNQILSNFEYIGNSSYEEHIFSILEKAVKNELILKGAFTSQSLLSALIAENFYYLSYDIEFDGDDFKRMSDGKKAFVVLKLLLDFSDKDCPILIDQPEDDLDNRAIFIDLVQYLKRKKKIRQIIVATHNSNIVVGADSEEIIAANQHGLKNFNREGKKFQYVTGSLENTIKKNPEISEILESQGMREHICEILEGGNKAFKMRERKYSLPEIIESFI